MANLPGVATLRADLAPHLERMEKIVNRIFPGEAYAVTFLARHPSNPKAHVLLTLERDATAIRLALDDLDRPDTDTLPGARTQ